MWLMRQRYWIKKAVTRIKKMCHYKRIRLIMHKSECINYKELVTKDVFEIGEGHLQTVPFKREKQCWGFNIIQ